MLITLDLVRLAQCGAFHTAVLIAGDQDLTEPVRPVATDTEELSEHLGWQRVGATKAAAGAVSPFFDAYLLLFQANL
jgi:hypothetical protein